MGEKRVYLVEITSIFPLLRRENASQRNNARLDPRDRNADDAETYDVPDAAVTSETMAESAQDGPDEIFPEVLHEIRPSVDDMLADLLRVRVLSARKGDTWHIVKHVDGMATRPAFDGHTARLAGMTFYMRPKARRGAEGGLLLSYTDANGREQRPAYVASKPRGGKRPHRGKAAAQTYMARPAVTSSPQRAESHGGL